MEVAQAFKAFEPLALRLSADRALALLFFLAFTWASVVGLALAFPLALSLALSLGLSLSLGSDLPFDFFWLGIFGVSSRSLGDNSVPRQLAWPHQQGYSAFSFLV